MKTEKYKYLRAVKFTVLNQLLDYSEQVIRLSKSNPNYEHERLFQLLDDAIGEVIEKVGGVNYKKYQEMMKRNPNYKLHEATGIIAKKYPNIFWNTDPVKP